MAFQRFLPSQGAAGREQPLPHGSSSYREAQKESVAAHAKAFGWGSRSLSRICGPFFRQRGLRPRGLWSGHHLTWHINWLEMLAVFQALKHFLPDLRDHHVLMRTDNTAVVSYINHQGGRAPCILTLRPVWPKHFCTLVQGMSPKFLLSSHSLWRRVDQLLVCYGPPKRGLIASKQTLSRWIVDDINIAYESSDLPSPMGVKAHSTRSMVASKAFHAGVPIQDICNAAGWSTPLSFVRFYGLDMRATPGSSVLSSHVTLVP